MSNGWECENLIHRQDFSLTGEFCDDSYFDIFEKKEEMQEKYKSEPYKADALMSEIRRKYTGQVMHIASCIKVVQQAMEITGKDEKEIDSVLETFIDSFTNNLDLKEVSEIFQIDESQLVETLMNEFRTRQNWTEKMAGQDRKEGLVMDDAIYNSHIGNEDFYAKISKMITERINDKEISKGKDEPKRNKFLNFISRIINNVKSKVKRKDIKMLPESTRDIKEESNVKQNKKNEFLESIKVSSEQLTESVKKQQTENEQIIEDKKDAPSLGD